MKRPLGLPMLARDAFTLIELLVVIAIIAVLATLTVPAVSGAIASSKSAKCLANLRQIGVAMIGYTSENNGRFPVDPTGADSWAKFLGPYFPTAKGADVGNVKDLVYRCPAETNLPPSSFQNSVSHYIATYAMVNGNSITNGPKRLAGVQNPSKTLLVVDGKLNPANNGGFNCNTAATFTAYTADIGKANPSTSTSVAFRHKDDSLNAVYVDGHVGTVFWTNRTNIIKPMWNGSGY